MSEIARIAGRLLGALVVFAALASPGQSDPLQGQVIRDGASLSLSDGFVTLPYMSPRGRLLVEPSSPPGAPLTVSTMPFRRLHSAPIRLKAIGPVPKSFPISRPPEATTYRIVVPCDVDIRLLGTMTAEEAVTEDTGVLYLARTEATMGTTRPNFISAMTIGTPTADCTPEMHYGMGGG